MVRAVFREHLPLRGARHQARSIRRTSREWCLMSLEHFADAMAHVGQAIEAGFERQQIEWVFGLTGGELEKEKLRFLDENGDERSWKYHFGGVPDWAQSDFDIYESGVDYFT